MFDELTVATFDHRTEAENALRALAHDGIPISKLSIVGVDLFQEEHALRYFHPGERILYWALWPALWGALWGLMFGPMFVHIPFYGGNLPGIVHVPPGVGHFFAIHAAASPWALLWGPVINGLIFGLFGTLTALAFGLGTPKNTVVKYENIYSPGKYLLVLKGSADEVARSRSILDKRRLTAPVNI